MQSIQKESKLIPTNNYKTKTRQCRTRQRIGLTVLWFQSWTRNLCHHKPTARKVSLSHNRYHSPIYSIYRHWHQVRLQAIYFQCLLSTSLFVRPATKFHISPLSVQYLKKNTLSNWALSFHDILKRNLVNSTQTVGVAHIPTKINVFKNAVVENSCHQIGPYMSWRCYQYLFLPKLNLCGDVCWRVARMCQLLYQAYSLCFRLCLLYEWKREFSQSES